MIGQLITSLLCGVYVFTILRILHVPNAALLAVIAGVFDILPLIGFFLAIIPALIIAVALSPITAGLVLVLYTTYHLIENYFIVPKVYGDRLRLSTLTVLVSCMAAALIVGVVGAIVILPIVASYPIIERIWLRRHLEADTVSKHIEIDAEEHLPVINTILGEKNRAILRHCRGRAGSRIGDWTVVIQGSVRSITKFGSGRFVFPPTQIEKSERGRFGVDQWRPGFYPLFLRRLYQQLHLRPDGCAAPHSKG